MQIHAKKQKHLIKRNNIYFFYLWCQWHESGARTTRILLLFHFILIFELIYNTSINKSVSARDSAIEKYTL